MSLDYAEQGCEIALTLDQLPSEPHSGQQRHNPPGQIAEKRLHCQDAVVEDTAERHVDEYPQELSQDIPKKEPHPGITGDTAGKVHPWAERRDQPAAEKD